MAKFRFLALVGGIFHRNEKIQKTKVIYFMFGTYCRLGVPKIQKVQIITHPSPPKILFHNKIHRIKFIIKKFLVERNILLGKNIPNSSY